MFVVSPDQTLKYTLISTSLIIAIYFPRVVLMILSSYWYLEMLTDLFQAPKTSSKFGCLFLPYGTNLNPVNQILIKINYFDCRVSDVFSCMILIIHFK